MKRLRLIILVIICILGTAACGSSGGSANEISFKDMDFKGVTRIDLGDLHTGDHVSVTDETEIDAIVSFIKEIKGTNAQSSKGYYEGTYDAVFYVNDDNVFAVGFGDSNIFNYGEGADGYPVRYDLTDKTIKEDIIPFFSQFFMNSSGAKPEVSPADKSIYELTDDVYPEATLSKIVDDGSSLEELNKRYPVKCMRDINGTFRVSYLGKDSIAVLFFDASGERLFGRIYQTTHDKADYSGLKTGDPLDEVMTFDPEGEYLFLETGKNTPRESTHCTRDGYIITITYDDSNNIIKIEEALI